MAAGDLHVFAKYVSNTVGPSLQTLWASNLVKLGFITNALTPNIADSDPRWGAGGSQDFSTVEVTPGGSYSAGGLTISGTSSSQAGATTSLNGTSPLSIAAHASNPANARWGIFYDNTDAGKRAYGFLDLGTVLSLVPGLQMNINGQPSGAQPIFQVNAT